MLPILPILCCIVLIRFAVAQDPQTTNTSAEFIAYDDDYYSSIGPNPQQRAENEGYAAETHEVTTEDGYILQIHRITGSPVSSKADNKTIVILLHGLFECSSTWVVGSPQESCWHEMGLYDLPAMIDYALRVTKQKKLMYVGYSQGTTVFFVMASLRPEYQTKIEAMFALAPGAFLSHMTLPLFRIIAPFSNEIKRLGGLIGVYELKPAGKIWQEIIQEICNDDAATQDICMSIVSALISPGEKLFNKTVVAEALKYDPAGVSIKQFAHIGQLVNSGRFCQYDYGPLENVIKYGALLPPNYPIGNIAIPMYLYYGTNDPLTTPTDVEMLCKKLPTCQKFLVPEPSFTHFDFVWSTEMDTLVYDDVLKNMAKYS